MKVEELSLFNTKREFFIFLSLSLFIVTYSLLIEYNNYKLLTQFNSAIVKATVIKQYTKTKETKNGKLKSYQVLKLHSEKGFSFYTTLFSKLPNSVSKNITLELFAGEITFYEYLRGFYAYSKFLDISNTQSNKQKLNNYLSQTHKDKNISYIYQALYTASPLSRELQTSFSKLGISHLLAISGFHLGVLSTLLFMIIKYPYKILQNRYFPYRNSQLDIFIFITFILLAYLLFLDSPASLLRAFAMLVIGFFLYDRGFKIISMQTLFITLILLLAFFPRLFFTLGFWLSIAGVFYIFLFLLHFKHLSKTWQFVLVPIWVYLLMLPFSLSIFGNFTLLHPLSIIWTVLFTLFYPLSILLHLVGYGDLFDGGLSYFVSMPTMAIEIKLHYMYLILHIVLSLLSIYKKSIVTLLLLYSLFILSIKMYNLLQIS